ncbi:mechanosensitive ion channel family protein [Yunchengibacter salinarum]|uniref:mechanosensitive ion channel family protein n=1 Tax=Yunchengibacter salinarum TaxID=3133399 RepID=UPI0035B58702
MRETVSLQTGHAGRAATQAGGATPEDGAGPRNGGDLPGRQEDLAFLDWQSLSGKAQAALGDLLIWLQSHVLTLGVLLEGTAALIGFLIALPMAGPARRLVRRPFRALSHAPMAGWPLERLGQALGSVTFPIIWGGVVLLAGAVFQAAGHTPDVLRILWSLIGAWIIIRLLGGLMTGQPWVRALAGLVWLVAALNILRLLDPTIAIMDGFGMSVGDGRISLYSVTKGVVVGVALVWLALTMARIIQAQVEQMGDLSPSIRLLVSQALKFVLVAAAIITALNSVGIDLTALAFLGGAVGVGLGFGLQKVVSNIVSGFILLSDRSLKPGDVIEVGDTYGWVNSFSARYTSVVTRDGTEHLIPNETLVTQPVTNWSYTNQKVRRKIPVGISYDSDIDKATELMLSAAEGVPRVLSDPPPNCLLKEFGESSVNFELRIWIEDPENGVSNVADVVLRRIWHLFREHGIKIPYPQRDIHIAKSASDPSTPPMTDSQ